MAVRDSIVHFLRWTLNILISRGGDGNLLHELRIFNSETREAHNKVFLLPFVFISIVMICLVSLLAPTRQKNLN